MEDTGAQTRLRVPDIPASEVREISTWLSSRTSILNEPLRDRQYALAVTTEKVITVTLLSLKLDDVAQV